MKSKRDRGFLIPLRLTNLAIQSGVSVEKLQFMLQRSARCTHPAGNRRYHDYIFNVEGNRVLGFLHEPEMAEDEDTDHQVYKCDVCKDTRKVQVFNECPRCHGEGCPKCDEGLLAGSIPCPECKAQKTFKHHH